MSIKLKILGKILRGRCAARHNYLRMGCSGNNALNLNAVVAVALFCSGKSTLRVKKTRLDYFHEVHHLRSYRRHERALDSIRVCPCRSVCGAAVFVSAIRVTLRFAIRFRGGNLHRSLEEILLLHIREPHVHHARLTSQHALHQHALKRIIYTAVRV